MNKSSSFGAFGLAAALGLAAVVSVPWVHAQEVDEFLGGRAAPAWGRPDRLRRQQFELQGKALGEYAVKTLKLKLLAVIDDATAYGQGLADEFAKAVKASGGEVVKHEHTNDKAVDFAAVLTAIKAAKPEAIFFGGYDQQAAPMAKQMRQLGMNIKLMGGETMNSAKFIELAGPAAEGSIASTPGAALESRPGGKAFADKYKARFGQEVGLYAPYFYDGVMVIAAAMKASNSTDPAKYFPVLARSITRGSLRTSPSTRTAT